MDLHCRSDRLPSNFDKRSLFMFCLHSFRLNLIFHYTVFQISETPWISSSTCKISKPIYSDIFSKFSERNLRSSIIPNQNVQRIERNSYVKMLLCRFTTFCCHCHLSLNAAPSQTFATEHDWTVNATLKCPTLTAAACAGSVPDFWKISSPAIIHLELLFTSRLGQHLKQRVL